MTIRIRSLNEVGVARFSVWLDNPAGEPPRELLEDDSASEVIKIEYRIDPSRRFASSYELGEYLSKEVFRANTDRLSLLPDYGMWSWISLALIDSLLKKGRGVEGKPLAKPHYIMYVPRLTYRLIARTAWDLVTLHGEAARVALGSSKSPWGDMAEQMTSRQEIYAHRSIWPVANALYSMPDGSVKRGATSRRPKKARRDPNNKAGLGGVRRLPFTFRQFERTYNLRRMTGEQITGLLPNEYQKWRKVGDL